MKGIKRIVNIEEGISLLLAKVINDFLAGYQILFTAFILIGEKNE